MRKRTSFLFAVIMAVLAAAVCSGAFAAEDTVTIPEFENGMAQPVFGYTNLRDVNYTNEGSDILRFCVYVETDYDTDSDGKADLVEAFVQVPRSAAEGAFKAATIYDPTPYGAGTVEENPMNSVVRMIPSITAGSVSRAQSGPRSDA